MSLTMSSLTPSISSPVMTMLTFISLFLGGGEVLMQFKAKSFSYYLDPVLFHLLKTLLHQSFPLSYIFKCLHS